MTTNATDSVADLLLGIGDGDPVAWEEILRQYGKLVSTTVRSFRLQDADARDAVQATWLHLAENAHRVQCSERLGGLLVATARRECLHILRQAKRTPDAVGAVADTVADPSVGPERRSIEADVARMLGGLVEELSPSQRILLQALFTDYTWPSYAEITCAVGIPHGGIGPTRARALRQLQRRLDECLLMATGQQAM